MVRVYRRVTSVAGAVHEKKSSGLAKENGRMRFSQQNSIFIEMLQGFSLYMLNMKEAVCKTA